MGNQFKHKENQAKIRQSQKYPNNSFLTGNKALFLT